MSKKSFITFVIGLVMLSGPLLVAADTGATSSMETEIQSLRAHIQDLQGKLAVLLSLSGGVTSSTGSAMSLGSCYSYGRSLSLGTRGGDVSALQHFLNSQGFSIPAGITGYFGGETKSALAHWQGKNNIAVFATTGSGIFGPLSRGMLSRTCGIGVTSTTSTASTYSFKADPQSGVAPLDVAFTASAPISNGSSTFSVDFGDSSAAALMTSGSCLGIMGMVGGQSGIRCSFSAAHTYIAAGTYTARLMHDTCPTGAQCFVGPLTVATSIIRIVASTTPAADNIVRMNAPGNVTLALHNIAEIRNEKAYFTLTDLTATTTTIQITPVGCWNFFPSDTPPEMRCMIAVMPIAPVTLTVGQTYRASNYTITLSKIEKDKATFSVSIVPTL